MKYYYYVMKRNTILIAFALSILAAVALAHLFGRRTHDSNGFESMLEGNKYFQQHNFDGFIETQHPHTAVLCCSDSRAPPEEIFNQTHQGQLFIVREAGQVPNNNSIASLEFAVAVLGVKTILVLGHTECGAVAAAMSGDKLPSNALTQLASEIRLNAHPGDDLNAAISHHTEAVANYLKQRSEILAGADIKWGVYDVRTGQFKLG
jgi:carbonic anhydrase